MDEKQEHRQAILAYLLLGLLLAMCVALVVLPDVVPIMAGMALMLGCCYMIGEAIWTGTWPGVGSTKTFKVRIQLLVYATILVGGLIGLIVALVKVLLGDSSQAVVLR